MAKVALIYPFDERSYYRPKYPSIGLGCLSSFLRSNAIDAMVIDAKFDGISLDRVKKQLIDFQPDILGFTSMTHEINVSAEWASELKELFPQSIMLIGGAHATVAPVRTLEEFSVFDISVIGEGEHTLLELVKLLDENRWADLGEVEGIVWRKESDIILNKPRPPIKNLDSLPYPNYDHIKSRMSAYPIFTSRGCPSKCVFCCRILGDRIRVRSPEKVVDEISSAIQVCKPDLIEIADDTFTIPKERAIEICDLMIQEGLSRKIKWFALSRVNGVDQELFDKMKSAGCEKVDFGVESGNQEILKQIKKGISIEDAKKAVKLAKKAGLKTGCYFIVGHPYETIETIKNTIKLAAELNPSVISFGIMVPYPGTEIYRMAQRGEGNYRLLSESWDDYDKQIGNALEIEGISRGELEKWQRMAYLYVYVKNFRFMDLFSLVYSQRRLAIRMLQRAFKQS